ncbi:uncharacterized protein B0H18DRAFT_1028262 [Fomitopsis serialis]|uniref:uncharacterized protein n=1 Tax=Fomitopsis serialis TaxID=139415 RepID=UPI00200772E2|nr:uncharacterized protein B0H18DRAFT_1028262 [Neoantrodia serialis]KAH9919309.1 hypothetical protein B0H18DRAFT_1028262 [Neoantrodia serialis]
MPVTTRSAKQRPQLSVKHTPDKDDAGKSHKSKRRRRTRAAKPMGSSDTENAPLLSGLPALPLEIIFELFASLKPVDLANLAQTNGAFRATLTSPQASIVWKAARKRTANAPDCPPLVSEVPWARFIYGSFECLKCGRPGIRNLDFALMRHVCGVCKGRLVDARTLRKEMPSVDPVVLELLPHTTFFDLRFYWPADVRAIAKIYGGYKRNVESQMAGAKKMLQEYRKERRKHVQEVLEHAKKCQAWLKEFEFALHDELDERSEQRYQLIAKRFVELGYEWPDIHAMRDRPESKHDGTLSEQVWKRIRPVLQLDIEIARCKRLDRFEARTIRARKALVKRVYYAYRQTLRPIEWIHLPPADYVYVIPVFRSLIYTHIDVPLEEAACDEAARRLPEYISAFRNTLKARLLRSMTDSRRGSTTAARTSTRPLRGDARLSLATSVFTLTTSSGSYLERCFGFDDLTAQLAYRGEVGIQSTAFWVVVHDSEGGDITGHGLSYDLRVSKTVESLIAALGLDPETARPEDLDRLEKRVLCGSCQSMDWPGLAQLTDQAYSWRSAILHYAHIHNAALEAQTWRILTPDECDIVRRAEDAQKPALQSMWSCNHCIAYAEQLLSHSAVQSHVREEHNIAEPEEDVDFFHAHPTVRWNPQPQSLSRSLRLARQGTTGQVDDGDDDEAERSVTCVVS